MLDASNRANSWANQRKEAIDKAKRLREERKMNLALAGGMSVANETGANHIGRITSSENQYREFQKPLMNDYIGQKKPATMKYGMSMLDQQPSDEELTQARSSLRLLKSKMKESGGFPKNPEKQRGYFEEETHEYMPYAPGDKKIGQDQNFNDVYQNGNQNYRKVFKPVLQDDRYQRMNDKINNQLDQIDQSLASKNRALNRVNQHPPNDYQPQFGGGMNQNGRGVGKPPMGMNKYDSGNGGYSHPQNDYFSDFSSQNIPSRIPKNTLSSNKTKPTHTINSNYNPEYEMEPNRQKFGDFRSPINNESPTKKGGYNDYNNYNNANNQQHFGGLGGNALQKNKAPENSFNKPNISNKNVWPNNNNKNNYHDDEPEDTKAFSKPSFKKNTTPKAKTQVTYDDERFQQKPSKTNQNLKLENNNSELPPEYADEGPLEECPVGCGRKFNPEALEKHANICKKVFLTKRKKFDSSQQRATDELNEVSNENKYNNYYPKGKAMPKSKPGAASKGGKAKWKAESEAFRANLKAARGATLTKEEQNAVSHASENLLVPCPHCGRKFNDQAAQRHIPFCASKQKVDGIKKGGKGRY